MFSSLRVVPCHPFKNKSMVHQIIGKKGLILKEKKKELKLTPYLSL
jgi:hypothetical protein